MTKLCCVLALGALLLASCTKQASSTPANTPSSSAAPAKKRAYTEPPPLDPNNIVSVAIASKDHTTLVEALKAANYVRSVANPGPLTVFAPTNAAFEKLPAGTVETLLKPENQDKLKEILKYHVAVSVYKPEDLVRMDGKKLGMANLKNVEIKVVDGKPTINGAHILGSHRCSNGIIHIIDTVLLPPE